MKIVIKREYGNVILEDYPVPFNGRWVARDEEGNYIGHDKYYNDLSDRLRDHEIEKIGV